MTPEPPEYKPHRIDPETGRRVPLKRWPGFRAVCTRCGDRVRSTPLYPTTKEERRKMAKNFICHECDTP